MVEKTVCFLFCKWPLLLQIPLDLGSLPMKHPVFPEKIHFVSSYGSDCFHHSGINKQSFQKWILVLSAPTCSLLNVSLRI